MEQVPNTALSAPLNLFRLAGVGLAAALVVLASLLVGGQLDPLDRFAVAHLMPGLDPAGATGTVPPATGIFMPFGLGAPSWQMALELSTYPASVLVSILVFAVACRTLVRRGDPAAAGVWAAAWIVANAVEVLLKVGLTKPALTAPDGGTIYHLQPFDHSFPSGHAMRAVLVAGIVAFVWRRFAVPAAAWALLVPALLVASSAHVPSDVMGGFVLGLLVVVVTVAVVPYARARMRPAVPG